MTGRGILVAEAVRVTVGVVVADGDGDTAGPQPAPVLRGVCSNPDPAGSVRLSVTTPMDASHSSRCSAWAGVSVNECLWCWRDDGGGGETKAWSKGRQQ